MARKALLIGVSTYKTLQSDNYSYCDLPCALHDIDALSRVLASHGGFKCERIENPDHIHMHDSIATFASSLALDETALLYFSGHGCKTDSGRLHFLTADTEKAKKDEWGIKVWTAVPASFVSDAIGKSRARSKVIILDCCFSGAYDSRHKGAESQAPGLLDAFRFVEGVAVLTSSDSTQYSQASIAGRKMSAFTHFMVEGIETGAADKDEDGRITVGDLYEYIAQQITNDTLLQSPQIDIQKGPAYNIEIARSPHTDKWQSDMKPPTVLLDILKKPGREVDGHPLVVRSTDGKVMLLIRPILAPWFYVDKYPVTASQYRWFMTMTTPPRTWTNIWHNWPECDDFPVTNVSPEDAEAYATRFGKRLPTRQEWCLAASGGIEPFPLYPWGNEFEEERCNALGHWSVHSAESRSGRPEPTIVNKFRAQNQAGVCDIVGNIYELAYYNRGKYLLGGCHESDEEELQIRRVPPRPQAFRQPTPRIGFRCVATLFPSRLT